MPEGVVLRDLALLGNLAGLGFELLQADHIGPIAREPFAELRLARADAVDVPGGDLQVVAL